MNPEKFAETALATIEGGLMLSKLTGKKSYLMNALAQVEDNIRRMAS